MKKSLQVGILGICVVSCCIILAIYQGRKYSPDLNEDDVLQIKENEILQENYDNESPENETAENETAENNTEPSYLPNENDFIISKTCDTIESLQNIDANDGEIIKVLGYDQVNDHGGGIYKITNKSIKEHNGGTVISLVNGLKAILMINNNTVSIAQFGAKNDGVTDNSRAINLAINSGVKNIIFEKGEYKVKDYITLSTDHVNINGNGCTIFTDNDYRSINEFYEWLFNIRADNIEISNLNIIAKETKPVGYITQLCILSSDNIMIKNCNFTVPQTSPSIHESGEPLQYNNIDLYSDWNNVTIENCNLSLLHDGEAGGCIWIRDLQNKGCSGLVFKNNNCVKTSHDEILAIFSGIIRDVEINENNFIMNKGRSTSSAMCFTIGSESSVVADNITFSNNMIDCKATNGLIWFGNTSNVNIENNHITYTKSNGSGNCIVFSQFDDVNLNDIKIKKNKIDIMDETSQGIDSIANTLSVFSENEIICSAIVKDSLFAGPMITVRSNVITSKNSVYLIGNGLKEFSYNIVEQTGPLKNLFQYWNMELESDVTISNNKIVYSYHEEEEKEGSLLIVNQALLNNHKVMLEDNSILASYSSRHNLLCFLVLKDTIPQTIIIRNNIIEGFEGIYHPD